MVFGLIAYDALDASAANAVLSLVVVTVTLSVLAHGLSAGPLAARYGDYVRTLHDLRPEHASTTPLRTRPGLAFGSASSSAAVDADRPDVG